MTTSNLSGKYLITTRHSITGKKDVYFIDPETGIVIGSVIFTSSITGEDRDKFAGDMAAFFQRDAD